MLGLSAVGSGSPPPEKIGVSQNSTFLSAESYSGRKNVDYAGEAYDRFNGFVEALEKIQKYRAVRVVMLFRNHIDWLRSGYLHQVRTGTRKTFDSHVKSFSEADLNWTIRARLLSKFDSRFYDYEDLRLAPQSVIRDMCIFFDVKFPYSDGLPGVRVNSAPTTVAGLRFQWVESLLRRILLGAVARPVRTSGVAQLVDNFAERAGFLEIRDFSKTLRVPDCFRLRAVEDWEQLEPFLRKVA